MDTDGERWPNSFRFLIKLKRSLRKRELLRRFGQKWNAEDNGFQSRKYDSYEAYLEHQKAKLATHDFGNYDAKFRDALQERLRNLDLDWPGRTVLCLGARIGTEVKAFLDLGCFAVGIDLNPGSQNRYVLKGDFHHLQFPAKSVDVVYTNSLDHLFDEKRVAGEVKQVLKQDGLFIVEAVHGAAQGVKPGFFESFFWDNIDDLIRMFEQTGFALVRRFPITFPWPGETLLFKTKSIE